MFGRRGFCALLLAGAIPFGPATSLSSQAQDPQTPATSPAATGSGENVQPPRAKYAPDPPYSPEARAKKIEGAVLLRAVIGADGTLKDLSVVSGDPLLAAAALAGVRRWTFDPKRVNGKPVEAEVPICVAFTLMSGPATPLSCAQNQDSSEIQPGAILYQVPPIYPAKARKKHIEGIVVLQATIGADGLVEELSAVSGNPILIPAALDAVRKWRYAPALVDGKPVKITTKITIAFKISSGAAGLLNPSSHSFNANETS